MLVIKKGVDSLSYHASKHFKYRELVCSCADCSVNIIDTRALEVLEKVRYLFGQPIVISSGFRCPQHNAHVGGALHSDHLSGRAFDLVLKGPDQGKLVSLCKKYFQFAKIGEDYIHCSYRP